MAMRRAQRGKQTQRQGGVLLRRRCLGREVERLRLWPRVQQYHHPTHEVTFGVITFGAITSSTHKALLTAPARASHSPLTCVILYTCWCTNKTQHVCVVTQEREHAKLKAGSACSATWRSGGVFQRHPMPLAACPGFSAKQRLGPSASWAALLWAAHQPEPRGGGLYRACLRLSERGRRQPNPRTLTPIDP